MIKYIRQYNIPTFFIAAVQIPQKTSADWVSKRK